MKKTTWVVAAVALAVASVALAEVLTATWENPTTNTDGSAIPATGAGSLASSRLEYGTCTGSGSTLALGTKLGEVVTNTNGTTAKTPDLAPGTYCGQVRVTNTYGSESDPSPVAQKVVAAPKPNKPTNFSWN